MNISQQLFDYKITFVNSQFARAQIQKVICNANFKDFWYTKINQIWYDEFN